MPALRAGTAEQLAFAEDLVEARLLIPTGVPGVFGRGTGFEAVRAGFDRLVTRAAAPEHPQGMYFPPIFPREQLETNGYLASFPHLAGTVFGFEGGEDEAADQLELASRHEAWSAHQRMSDMVLLPAACYPLYPAVAASGPLAPLGVTLDTGDSFVFRREPSSDPARMQIFHMREIVRIADKDTVLTWREGWRSRAEELLGGLGLELELEIANDPFFGRSGRLLASQQRQQELKWELVTAIAAEQPTAIASCNYHQDHFGQIYDLRTATGALAHTGCMAFGEERVTLALLRRHGLDTGGWPSQVRTQLGLDG